jgi:hypothetical protein
MQYSLKRSRILFKFSKSASSTSINPWGPSAGGPYRARCLIFDPFCATYILANPLSSDALLINQIEYID